MNCPNCTSPMTPLDLENIEVDHCANCGATFFDENEINRITISDALYLSNQKLEQTISGDTKICPRDKTILRTYQQESIPQHTVLLHCSKCGGIFTFASDLVEFKTAQNAKIAYYKTWAIPAPRISNLIVMSLVGLVFVISLYSSRFITQPASTSIQAQEALSGETIIASPNGSIMCFSTKYLYTSRVIFTNTKTGTQSEKTISSQPSRTHCATVSTDEISADGSYLYKIVLSLDKSTIITQNRIYQPKKR